MSARDQLLFLPGGLILNPVARLGRIARHEFQCRKENVGRPAVRGDKSVSLFHVVGLTFPYIKIFYRQSLPEFSFAANPPALRGAIFLRADL